jgi:surfeit locus 1 family protein
MTLRLPVPVLIGLLLAVTALLIALGIWQLQRNDWKNGLVEQRNARTDAAPLTFEAARDIDLDALDYHRLADGGTWDHEHSFILANRARFSTKGEELVTPLLLAPGGPAVLVNRGWYPDGEREAVQAKLASRPATVQGLISVHTSSARQTAVGTWTGIDPVAMASDLPYELLPWIVIEGDLVPANANPDGVLPVQRYAAFANTTPHMEYALTWFGLAAALIGVAIMRFRPQRTRAQSAEAPPTEETEHPE